MAFSQGGGSHALREVSARNDGATAIILSNGLLEFAVDPVIEPHLIGYAGVTLDILRFPHIPSSPDTLELSKWPNNCG